MNVFITNRFPLLRQAPIIALGALVLAGCDSKKTTGPTQTAQVRLVNASSFTPSADVFVSGRITASTLVFKTSASSCVSVPAGTPTILSFQPTGGGTATLITQTFVANGKYTVLLYGTTTTSRTAVALNDLYTAPAAGNAAIRFFNASATAGAVHATPPATTTLSASTLVAGAENISPNSATSGGFLTVPKANSRIRFMDVGGFTGTPRTDINPLALPGAGVTTVFFLDAVTAGSPNWFTTDPCP